MDGHRICEIHRARVSLGKIHDALDIDVNALSTNKRRASEEYISWKPATPVPILRLIRRP